MSAQWLTPERLSRYNTITANYRQLWFHLSDLFIQYDEKSDWRAKERIQKKFDYFFKRYFERVRMVSDWKERAYLGERPRREDNK